MADEQLTGIDCSWFSDCIYFKQLCKLKMKVDGIKQENDKLHKLLSASPICDTEMSRKADELRQENERLRMIIVKVKDIIKNGCYPEFDWLFESEVK